MSKRILSALLIAALVIGVSSVVTNAVTGKFTIDLTLVPKTTALEKVQFDMDFQVGLDFKFTISGLESRTELMFGVAGVEYTVLTLSANLGALTVKDEFVFATPFATAPPIPFNYAPIGPLLFVKKRVTAEISLGGITIKNLAMFEDVNFLHPFPVTTTSYTAADQAFGFGNVLTVSGETPSGIGITMETGICATQDDNVIKKKKFPYSVNRNCQPVRLGVSEEATESFKVVRGDPLPGITVISQPTKIVVKPRSEVGISLIEIDCWVAEGNEGPNPQFSNPVGAIICKKVVSLSAPATNLLDVKVHIDATASPFFHWKQVSCGGSIGNDIAILNPGFFVVCDIYIALPDTGATVFVKYQATEDLPERKPPLFFDFEKIRITGIKIGPLTLDVYLAFYPLAPIYAEVTSRFSLPPFSIVAVLETTDITRPDFFSATVTLTAPGITATQRYDSDFALERTDVSITARLDPAPASLTTSLRLRSKGAPSLGLTRLINSLRVDLGGGTFVAFTACFGKGTAIAQISLRCDEAAKPIKFAFASFSISAVAGQFRVTSTAFFGSGITTTGTGRGLRGADIRLELGF